MYGVVSDGPAATVLFAFEYVQFVVARLSVAGTLLLLCKYSVTLLDEPG